MWESNPPSTALQAAPNGRLGYEPERKEEDSNPEPVTTQQFSKLSARPLAHLPKSAREDLNLRITRYQRVALTRLGYGRLKKERCANTCPTATRIPGIEPAIRGSNPNSPSLWEWRDSNPLTRKTWVTARRASPTAPHSHWLFLGLAIPRSPRGIRTPNNRFVVCRDIHFTMRPKYRRQDSNLQPPGS